MKNERQRVTVAAPDGAIGPRTDVREYDARLRVVALLFTLPMLGLVARLWFLQVVEHDRYEILASDNFVREIESKPERGLIFDSQGRIVAENRPAYDVMASPRVLRKHPEAAARLIDLLSLPPERAAVMQERLVGSSPSDLLVEDDITRDQLAAVETFRDHLPGVYTRVTQRRHYPFDSLGGHVLGYMNEANADDLARLGEFGYGAGDYVGRTGLERAYEPVLHGAPGLERQVVNVSGEVQSEEVNRQLLGDYRMIDAAPGKNLHLTIDMQLMEIMEESAADAVSGGFVAIDPRDGSILAMYSKPGFNPNAWSGRLSEEEQRASDNNPFHPMLDKTVQSWFPASTYKFVTGIAALEEGVITPGDTITCPGHFDYGNRRFHCWNRHGHGPVDLKGALANSCDVYFYQTGLQLGIDTLASYAFEFGFGEKPGLGFNGESPGVVPTRAWHEEHGGFQYGFTVNTSVGQGDTRTSPLQLALAYAALANRGTLYYPRVVDRITTADNNVVFEYPRRVRNVLEFSPSSIEYVIQGLRAVVEEPFGTAYSLRLPYMHVAGKTGTAQVRSLGTESLEDGEVIHWHRDHAWFVAFAPIENPRIVVVAFLEHGGQGSMAAAPVAMRVVDRYFREVLGWNEEIELSLAGQPAALNALIAGGQLTASVPAAADPPGK